MEPFVNIFGKEIPIYGIAWILGTAIAAVIALLLSKKREIERYDLVYSAVFSMLAGAFGAKLLFIAVSLKTIIEQNIPFIAVLRGGFVFYGGLIGGAIGLVIYTRMFKLNTLRFFDLYALVVPLGHAVGRIGCFYSGCCYGMEYDGPFNVEYSSTLGMTPLGIPLLPVQLIEALLLALLFVVLLVVFFKCKSTGVVTVVYLYSYSFLRFVLEFLRGDVERGLLFNLSTSQIVSLLIVISVTVIILIKNKKQRINKQL